MFVALLTTITLLPALLRLFAPPGESKTPGFPWLAPVDDYLDRHRKPILIGTLVVVIGALPLLAFLRFDFNPLHLKDPNSESMATLLALKDSPEAAVNDVTLLAPSLAQADAAAKRLDALPEVGRTTTLSTFIPADQPAKRAAIAAAASDLLPALTQPPAPPATDAQRVAALKRVSDLLSYAAEDHPGRARPPRSTCRRRSRSSPPRMPRRATAPSVRSPIRCASRSTSSRRCCSRRTSRANRCRRKSCATGSRRTAMRSCRSRRRCRRASTRATTRCCAASRRP